MVWGNCWDKLQHECHVLHSRFKVIPIVSYKECCCERYSYYHENIFLNYWTCKYLQFERCHWTHMILLPCCPFGSTVSLWPIETSKVWLNVVMRLRSADIYKLCLTGSNWISTATGRKGLSVLVTSVSMLLCLLSSRLNLLLKPPLSLFSTFFCFYVCKSPFQIGLNVLHVRYRLSVHKADCMTMER